ncbi:helix-turn-helix domain-containing protein [Aquimarina megaterium]|uniref:helix-turn-helix domain-containing protein n=1 Tax=Aquimarina megaterium TaxID=1443666 RepID=UPI00094599DE|nr:helix-turn-helix domain-containing protein [Aquimarina megaterium]
MTKEIPNIAYNSNHSKIEGVEIILIEDLIKRSENLDHFPEKLHQLDFYLLAFYTQGETEHLVDFVWHKVKKNSLVYLAKGQVNAFKFKNDLKGFILLFTKDYFDKQLKNLPKDTVKRLFIPQLFTPVVQVKENSNINRYIELTYNEYHIEKNDFNKNAIIDALHTIILSKAEQIKKDQTSYLKESDKLLLFLKFKTLLEEEYAKNRKADSYAQKLNITYKHLNVICKEITNKTIKNFISEFIILEAKRKLINSSIKSTELSFLMGFEEPSNFVKFFKKHTGLTPNNFKSQYL